MGWSNHHTNGLIHYAPQQAYRGYTLITNVSGHDSRLIDMEGRVCHAWHSDEGIGYAYLLPNGNLLLRTGPAAEEVSFLSRPERELLPIGGRTVAGAILELDWDSNVVWEYRYPLLHHDFERQPNGNTLICEGAPGRILEVTPGKEIVWEYINPFMARSGYGVGGSTSGLANSVFRAHRYGYDHPALVGKELDPARYANLNRLYS